MFVNWTNFMNKKQKNTPQKIYIKIKKNHVFHHHHPQGIDPFFLSLTNLGAKNYQYS